MTAPRLTIERLTASLPGAAGARLDRLLRGLAAGALDSALGEVELPPGSWCLRRLDVPVRLDLSQPDAALQRAWARELVTSIRAAATGADPAVVHYRTEREAAVDMLVGLALGRCERAWAWRQLGLLPMGENDQVPRRTLAAALARTPEQALGLLVTVVERAGVPAVDRALGEPGWAATARAVARAAGAHRLADAVLADAALAAAWPREPGGSGRSWPVADASHRSAEAWVRRAVEVSRLSAALRRGGVRPTPVTAAAWALLVVLEADPVAARGGPGAAPAVALAQTLLGRPSSLSGPESTVLPGGADDRDDRPAARSSTHRDVPADGLGQEREGTVADASGRPSRATGRHAETERAEWGGTNDPAVAAEPFEGVTATDTGPLDASGSANRGTPVDPAASHCADARLPNDRGPAATGSQRADRPPEERGLGAAGLPRANPQEGASSVDAQHVAARLPTDNDDGSLAGHEVRGWTHDHETGAPGTVGGSIAAGAPADDGAAPPAYDAGSGRSAPETAQTVPPPRSSPIGGGPPPPAATDATHPGGVAAEAPGVTRGPVPADRATAAHDTRWAGLPFLLNVADEAGLPDALTVPVFDRRPGRWLLAALGTCLLPVADDDPALLALCGLTPDDPSPLAGTDPPTDAERPVLTRVALAWAARLAARLRDTGAVVPADPVTALARVAERPGWVVADPAWIEVHLPVDQVDVEIRRAGLDLDPGWLPWLGAVVRFVYQEEELW